MQKGNNHPQSKLEETDIPLIFSLYLEELSLEDLARKFEVNRKTIKLVLTRATWQHVEIPKETIAQAQARINSRGTAWRKKQ